MVLQQLVRSILQFPEMFAQVASQGPIQAILILVGAVLVGVPVVILGVLTIMWLVQAFTPSRLPTRRTGR